MRVLCVGGLDPTGRAGLLADAWAVREAGGEPLAVATALTAQGGDRFSRNGVPLAVFTSQLDAALASGPLHGVKLGMIASRAQLTRLAARVSRLGVPVVVDPVTRSSRGEALSPLGPVDYLGLAPRGWVLTPNGAELAWLGKSPEALIALGFCAVLVKGGDTATDVLFAPGRRPLTLRSKATARSALHHRGTGCRLASALATELAAGLSLEAAARNSRRLVLEFLRVPILRPLR